LASLPAIMANTVPSHIVQTLAPTGKLRAAINFGNTVLAQKDPVTGEPRGACRSARESELCETELCLP